MSAEAKEEYVRERRQAKVLNAHRMLKSQM
jgi:hypothetical protein